MELSSLTCWGDSYEDYLENNIWNTTSKNFNIMLGQIFKSSQNTVTNKKIRLLGALEVLESKVVGGKGGRKKNCEKHWAIHKKVPQKRWKKIFVCGIINSFQSPQISYRDWINLTKNISYNSFYITIFVGGNSIREAFQSKKQPNLGISQNRGGDRQKIKKSQVSVGKSSKFRKSKKSQVSEGTKD